MPKAKKTKNQKLKPHVESWQSRYGYAEQDDPDNRVVSVAAAEPLGQVHRQMVNDQLMPILRRLEATDIWADERLWKEELQDSVNTCRELNEDYKGFYDDIDKLGVATTSLMHSIPFRLHPRIAEMIALEIPQWGDPSRICALRMAVETAQATLLTWLLKASDQLSCLSERGIQNTDKCNFMNECESAYSQDVKSLRLKHTEQFQKNKNLLQARSLIREISKLAGGCDQTDDEEENYDQ